MKKIAVLGMVVVLLVSGLILASCGALCPGDGTSGGKGNCVVPASGENVSVKWCTSKKCVAFKAYYDGNFERTETQKTCDC